MKPCKIDILSPNQLFITFNEGKKYVVTKEKWSMKLNDKLFQVSGVHVMETTGKIADDSMYSFVDANGKQRFGTIYDFYYKSKFEFSGYLFSVSNERIHVKHRIGNVYKEWSYAPDHEDNFSCHGQNNYAFSNELFDSKNPQLDWYVYGQCYYMFDDRLDMTRKFRMNDTPGTLKDISKYEVPDDVIGELKSMAGLLPTNPFDLLPSSEKPFFEECVRISNNLFSQNILSDHLTLL